MQGKILFGALFEKEKGFICNKMTLFQELDKFFGGGVSLDD